MYWASRRDTPDTSPHDPYLAASAFKQINLAQPKGVIEYSQGEQVTDYIVNIDETNASALLIEESHKRPVVVDFWAEWCEPCKVLMPLLEKIATEYQGAFLLAKVNAD